MTKVKEKLYDHRFGLFFFGFLMLYSFVISGNMQPWQVTNFSYSFYLVDFSLGFCSKLLPGAICNLLFNNITETKVNIFLTLLIILCFILVAAFLEKFYNAVEEKYKQTYFILFAFFLTGPATFSIYFELFCWLDLFWILAALIAVLCLCKKELYIFTVPLMFVAIMSHYGAIICYVPFVAVYMLYKIYITENKKEKKYLVIVWTVLVISSISLAFYMITHELENITLTHEQLIEFLSERGIEDTEYMEYAFFRRVKDIDPQEFFGENFSSVLLEIDKNQPAIKVFFDTLSQQIQVTNRLVDFGYVIDKYIIVLPIVIFLFYIYVREIISSKGDIFKQFVLLCCLGLFVLSAFFGVLLSTDKMRWLSHGLIPLFSMLFYMMYKERAVAERVKTVVEKFPLWFVFIFAMLYMSNSVN